MAMVIQKSSIDLGIVTTNGDAMPAFYRDVLGLTYEAQIPMPVGGGVMLRMPEHEIRAGVRIGFVADPDGNWVEFLSVTPKA